MSHKVVILKTKQQSLKQAEQFLRNRQWQIVSTTNLRDAIAAVIQRQPEFILVAADHPNKKVRALPKLIGQAFPVKVIGFVESSSSAGMAVLHEMGLEYNVFPPVSGPAIERIVLKMKRDEEKRIHDKQKGQDGTHTERGGHSQTVSGGDSSYSSARELLAKLASGDDEGNSDEASIIGNSSHGANPNGAAGQSSENAPAENAFLGGPTGGRSPGGAIVQKGIPGAEGPAGYIPSSNDKNDQGPSWIPQDPKPKNSEGTQGRPSEQTNSGIGGTSGDDPGIFSNPYASNWDTNLEAPFPGHGQRPPQPWVPNSPPREEDGGPPVFEHDNVTAKQKKPEPTYKQDPQHYPDRDSLVVKGTQAALDSSVTVVGDGPVEQIEQASNVACIVINSPRFSGYLVAALGKDRKIDKEFLDSVKERLFSFLRANGESVKEEDGMSLKLEQVEFEDWAIAQADFLRKSIHGTSEIAMAFFPSQETSAQLEQSAAENMLKMDIEELKDDVAVEFDLYVYLPTNQKYILYTPQGRKLHSEQRGRLKEKGVTHMHLRKDAQGQVKRYRAQVYLNDKIAEFQRRPKVGKAS